jgi:hypothetical protein
MSRTLESTQTPNFTPAVDNQSLDPVSSAVVNTSNTQEILRVSGLNNERMLERVPKYIRAGCEKVVQRGNSFIVLGRDRPGARDRGYGGRGHTGASAIDIVAGRSLDPNQDGLNYDPNMRSDSARIYISQKTDMDSNFNTPGVSIGKSGIGLKADAIRIIGRESIMLVTRTEDTNSRTGTAGYGGIQLVANNDATTLQPMVKGDNLVQMIQELDDRLKEFNTNLLNFMKDQNSFNLKVMAHTHQGVGGAIPGPVQTIPALDLIPAGVQSTVNLMEGIIENFKQRVNIELFEFKYLSGVTSRSINSKYNKVN